jgi:hypothetical protein
MSNLIALLIASAFALVSVAALADDDKNQAAYKMGMASQRQRDLQLVESQRLPAWTPSTVAESKALKEAAAKARAAYASMTPEEKVMYKKGMKEQRQLDLLAERTDEQNWTVEFAHRQDKELSTAKPKPLPQ